MPHHIIKVDPIMYVSNEVSQRCPQIFVHQPQNTNSLRGTGNNTTHMVYEGELTVKLHAKDVEVGTSSDRNVRQDQVTMGWLTVSVKLEQVGAFLPLVFCVSYLQ